MNTNYHNFSPEEIQNFARAPRNPTCQHIDATRIRVQHILEWISPLSAPHAQYLVFEGKRACAIYYEKNGIPYPVSVMGYDVDEAGNIHIHHIQGMKDHTNRTQKKLAFRVNAAFDVYQCFLKVIEKDFLQNGVSVYAKLYHLDAKDMQEYPPSFNRYRDFCEAVNVLNERYIRQRMQTSE